MPGAQPSKDVKKGSKLFRFRKNSQLDSLESQDSKVTAVPATFTLSRKHISNLDVISSTPTLASGSRPSYPLEDIPDDLLHEIASWCTPPTLLRASLACKRLLTLFHPYLHHTIDCSYTDLCRSAIKIFPHSPSTTRYIKNLILKPNREPSGWANSSEKSINEGDVLDVLEGIASNGDLPLLSMFKWFGKERPRDSFWLSLRENCPYLRDIGTSVGQKTLASFRADLELFKFQNLQGFHLFTQVSEHWTMTDYPINQDLPATLWNMLFSSDSLEELTLDGTCFAADAWNLKPVFSGRWPSLRKLALGNVWIDDTDSISDDEMMCMFFQAHPTLEEVSSLGTMFYSSEVMGCLLSMPKLGLYRGRLQQLQHANSVLSRIQSLDLSDWFSPSANLGDVLGDLPHLKSLSLYVNYMDSPSSQLVFYERLLRRCPQLRCFEISSTSWLSLRELSTGIRVVPGLRMLTVTRTLRKLNVNVDGFKGGSDLTKSAIQIATRNPNLREFTLRDVLPWDHLDQLAGVFRTKHIGRYRIEPIENHREPEPEGVRGRLPRVLNARESGVGAVRQRYERCFVRVITNPSG